MICEYSSVICVVLLIWNGNTKIEEQDKKTFSFWILLYLNYNR